MRNALIISIAAGLMAAALDTYAQSADNRAQPADKFYLGVDAGVAFQQQVSIRSGSDFGANGLVKFDTGSRSGLVLGYNWLPCLATELDASVIRNSIDSIAGETLSDFGANANLKEIPLLINGIYTLPSYGPIKPYVGAGVGAALGIFHSSNVPLSFFPGTSPHYSDTDISFAYQAEIGVNCALLRNLDLGLVYKFVGTTAHDWADNNIRFETDGTLTHTILATVTFRF